MNYEKAYKDALERARKCLDEKRDTCFVRPDVIFPELAESEDERIRKALIEYFKRYKEIDTCGSETFSGIPTDNILAWLEKQGEQKPANKIEAKFKIGDWVVQNGTTNGPIQIVRYEERDDGTIVWFNNGTGIYIEFLECYHKWTIQDAKDGDVLAWDDSKCIALFKNIYDEDSFNSHGFVGHCTDIFESRLSYHDIKGVHPATKEQCDHLFEKMKDAGYVWNEEKKEVKKIEKQASKSMWTEEDERCIDNCCLLIGAADDCYEKSFKDDCIHYLQSLKQRML